MRRITVFLVYWSVWVMVNTLGAFDKLCEWVMVNTLGAFDKLCEWWGGIIVDVAEYAEKRERWASENNKRSA